MNGCMMKMDRNVGDFVKFLITWLKERFVIDLSIIPITLKSRI